MPVQDEPQSAAETAAAAIRLLRDRLPPQWPMVSAPTPPPGADGPDAVVHLLSPSGSIDLVFEVKRTLTGRDVEAVSARLVRQVGGRPGSVGVVVARYLSPPVRDRLAKAGMSYIDATGNIRLTADEPALFVGDHGADSDPWRGPGRPRRGLKGDPAAKVVRALIDVDRAWTVRQLIEFAGASTGAAYRVIRFLEEEDLIEKTGRTIRLPDWVVLLRQWSRDYEFAGTNPSSRWLAPRGFESMFERMIASEVQYVVTGTLAAAEWAAYAPARAPMVYTPDAILAAEAWGLRRVETGANVMLAEPQSDVVFARTQVASNGGYTIAAPAQAAIDLMTGPGRNPSEAEELIDWMVANEKSWRQ